MDLAMAAQLIVNCRNKFVEMRSVNQLTGLVATWTKIISEAKSFARMHGITDVSIVERTKLNVEWLVKMRPTSREVARKGSGLQCLFLR